MAITQVRAQFAGQWTTLTYNSATGRYEGTIRPTAISSGEPGGYFSVTVEATNSTGQTATLSGASYPGLRLVVQDTTAPTVNITSPTDNLVTAAASVTVSGTAFDTSGVASVTVNGAAAALGADGSFSVSVNLSSGSNTIKIVATDTVGNAATVTRTVVRAVSGPALAITSPAAGALIRAESVTVSGTVSDSVSPVASVTVNGVSASVSGSTWSASVPLTEGANTLTATAANQVGLTTTVTRQVTRDTTAPAIAITSPADGLVTAAAGITVSGTVSDTHAVTVTVNGVSASVSGGTFSATVPLAGGSNAVTATATDAAGNVSSASRTVIRATQGPAVTVTSPAAGFITNQASVLVTGLVSDSVAAVSGVTVNGTAASISGGTFSATVPLTEGANTLTVVGTNSVGLTTTKTVSGTLDTAPPVISITAPTAEQMVSEASFTAAGTVSDGGSGIAGVTVNGTAASVADGTFSLTIDLAEGLNAITAIATDRAGNTAEADGSVLLDTVPPALTVTVPAEGLITNNPALTVTGTASDSGSGVERVTVNGQTAALTGSSFSLAITLAEGTNTVTVSAYDRVGHVTTVSRSVLLDTQRPVVALKSPPEGYLTDSSPTVIFSVADEPLGSGVDPDTIAALLDGHSTACTVTETAEGYQVTLQAQNLTDGPHSLTVTAYDRSGNQGTATAAYIVDTVPPELWLDGPGSHVVVDTPSTVVTGRVYDAAPVVVTVGGVSVEVDADGRFAYEVPLLVGENTIPVRAVDSAGLLTDRTVYMIRLITDRTAADAEALKAWLERPFLSWTAAERQRFLEARERGAYNCTDLNRVGTAAAYLADWLTQAGYGVDVDGRTDWVLGDIPTPAQMARYLANIVSIRGALPSEAPAVPPDMDYLLSGEANDIEAVLVAVDAVRPLLEKSCFISGEIAAGEY